MCEWIALFRTHSPTLSLLSGFVWRGFLWHSTTCMYGWRFNDRAVRKRAPRVCPRSCTSVSVSWPTFRSTTLSSRVRKVRGIAMDISHHFIHTALQLLVLEWNTMLVRVGYIHVDFLLFFRLTISRSFFIFSTWIPSQRDCAIARKREKCGGNSRGGFLSFASLNAFGKKLSRCTVTTIRKIVNYRSFTSPFWSLACLFHGNQ